MKTTVRILAMLLCLTMVLSACGGGASSPSSGTSSVASSANTGTSSVSQTQSLKPGDVVTGPTGADIAGGWGEKIADKADKDTLSMITGQDSGNLDPANNALLVGIAIEKHVFDTLIMKDAITGEFIPGLATAWEWVDETHLKLTLREGVKFHNGEDFTSEDVLKTVERFKAGSATASLYKVFSFEDSSANGDYEVTIGFKSPFAPAINYLAHTRASVIPADYLAENGEEALYQKPVGTGSYKFVNWNVGSDLDMTRNDEWWGLGEYADCFFKNIKVIFGAENAARAIAVEAGEVDIATNLESADFDGIFSGRTPHVVATKVTGLQVNFLAFNLNYEPWQDVNVRLAVAHAVDWKTVIEAVGGSAYVFSDSSVATPVFGYKSEGVYEYDPELSAKLLEEAGHKDGLTVTVVAPTQGLGLRVMEAVQPYLGEVGIKMEIMSVDAATWVEVYTKGTTELSTLNMTAMTYDPAHTLNQTVATAANITGRVEDERYNELYNAGLVETDETKRAQIYADLQDYIYEQAFQVPMYLSYITYAYWDYLDNVVPDNGIQLDLRLITLKDQ